MKKIVFSLMCGAVALSACSKDDDTTKPPESAEKLYNEAYHDLAGQEYKKAAKDFDEVERQHPYSEWASRAEIMSAFSSYQGSDYDTAIATFDHYVKLYPNNDSTPYAYYMIGLCYYEQISDVGRDQKITEKALQALREVVRRFPETEYARDAKLKIDLTVDHLAGKEMEIGRYYLRHEDYVSAINRFRYVIDTYQTTTHTPEALHRLVECYLRLGVPNEAVRYAAVLGYNFPNSFWYRDSYKLLTSHNIKPAEVTPASGTQAAAPQPEPQKPAENPALAAPPEAPSHWWNHLNPW